LQDKKSIYLYC